MECVLQIYYQEVDILFKDQFSTDLTPFTSSCYILQRSPFNDHIFSYNKTASVQYYPSSYLLLSQPMRSHYSFLGSGNISATTSPTSSGTVSTRRQPNCNLPLLYPRHQKNKSSQRVIYYQQSPYMTQCNCKSSSIILSSRLRLLILVIFLLSPSWFHKLVDAIYSSIRNYTTLNNLSYQSSSAPFIGINESQSTVSVVATSNSSTCNIVTGIYKSPHLSLSISNSSIQRLQNSTRSDQRDKFTTCLKAITTTNHNTISTKYCRIAALSLIGYLSFGSCFITGKIDSVYGQRSLLRKASTRLSNHIQSVVSSNPTTWPYLSDNYRFAIYYSSVRSYTDYTLQSQASKTISNQSISSPISTSYSKTSTAKWCYFHTTIKECYLSPS